MDTIIILILFASLLALSFAAFNFITVKRMPEGTERMKEIAEAIKKRTAMQSFFFCHSHHAPAISNSFRDASGRKSMANSAVLTH